MASPNRMPGQDSKATGRQALLGSHASAGQCPHRRVFPGGRQVRGKTRLAVDQSGGQATQGTSPRQPERPIAVRVRPPRNNWPWHSYCRCGKSTPAPGLRPLICPCLPKIGDGEDARCNFKGDSQGLRATEVRFDNLITEFTVLAVDLPSAHADGRGGGHQGPLRLSRRLRRGARPVPRRPPVPPSPSMSVPAA